MIINRYAKGGGLSPRIVVSVTTGATVTCSKGATTLTATSVDGKCSFNVNDYGVWTVSTDSDTQTVNVEYVQLYEVTLKTIGRRFAMLRMQVKAQTIGRSVTRSKSLSMVNYLMA